MTKTKFTLVVAMTALALVASGTPDAFAKGAARGRKNKVETVRMAAPASGASVGGKGSITITHGRKGDDAVLTVKGLPARTRYNVVDSATGDVLGTLKTNKKGRGTFDLTPGVGKRSAAATGGENAGDGTIPDVIDLVDPNSGDPILTGDTTGDLQALYGYASLGNATESATITMGSDPAADSQYFSFSYFAEPDADANFAGVYELYTETANGDELPLGRASVLDLAGKDFQVRNASGNIVFKGSLPDVEAYAIDDPNLPVDGGDPFAIWDDGTYTDPMDDPNFDPWADPSGAANGQKGGGGIPFDFGSWFQGGDPFSSFLMGGLFGGGMGGGRGMFKKGGVRDGVTDPTVDPPVDVPVEFTLWIETLDGFQKAGALVAPDYGFDDGWIDDWGGCGGDMTWDTDWDTSWDTSWDTGWDMTWDTGWDTGMPAGDPAGNGQKSRRGRGRK
ncbi:MAG: hypothetical protein K8T90_04400 [Planctomycetes bacterium]|nr:hypothetical protein [Planctomycetota bacterium]